MNKVSRMLVALSLMLAGSLVQAANADLYKAEQLVPEQLEQPTDAQLRQSLEEILIKQSGRSQVSGNPVIARALQAPAGFLQAFSYISTQTPVAAGDGREVLGLRLQLQFDMLAVEALLQEAGLTAIGDSRPDVLVWLVAQGAQQPRDFIAAENEIVARLQEQAQRRALPLMLPLLDLNDQQAVSPGDLWGGFEAPVMQASARYRADAVLVGRLEQQASGAWSSRWQLYYQGRDQQFSPVGSLSEQLATVVDSVSDQLLSSLAQPAGEYVEEGIVLEVSRLSSIADYLALLDYLRELPPVDKVLPSQLEADRVTLRVQVQGGVAALQEAIRLNPRIQSDVLQTAAEGEPLYYRWQ